LNNNPLDPAKIFSALTWFGELRFPLMFLPSVLVGLADFKIALGRVKALLLAPELDMEPEIDPSAKYGVEVINGEFIWETAPPTLEEKNEAAKKSLKITRQKTMEKKQNPVTSIETNEEMEEEKVIPVASHLTNLNIQIKKGDLVAVVGAVGSGKSSLLNAMIGEMKCISGRVIFNGSSGYAPQQAWIQNVTFEKNITFGLPYDKQRYVNAIRVCALEKDVQLLQDGDQTEIGERGINLSGGQKQRINLARCVYFDSDVVLLDDPLSAVDGTIVL
jgi:ABC-type multidrug transport system fused ATPase/permease subunit